MRIVNGKTRFPFKELALGVRFVFASEEDMPHSGLARGPWVRVSARKYCHVDKVGMLHEIKIGDWNTEVIPEEQP